MSDLRRQKRTSRLSIVLSVALHTLVVVALFFFAAREGMLGKQLKKIAVTMVPKEKPPEKPKEKAPEPKPQPEQPKTEVAKTVPPEAPQARQPVPAAAPVQMPEAVPVVAPPPAEVASFDFDEGKPVESTSDPTLLYKGFVEYSLRTRWDRPQGTVDSSYVAEVELAIDGEGRVSGTEWKKGSGNAAWDNSVRKVIAATGSFGRRPPKGFPNKVLVRFDVLTAPETPIE